MDKYHRKPEIPEWSNPPLEDHKGYILRTKADRDFFRKGKKVYFGDLHIHTNFSRCGYPNNGTIQENVIYAREIAKLDFISITDHAEHMDDRQYKEYVREIEKENKEGEFVIIPGYEWAGRGFPTCGHRNIYFRDSFGPIFRGDDPRYNLPGKLYTALKRIRKQKVIAPRHHTPYVNDWNSFDEILEPVIEIYSEWGNSESADGPLVYKGKGRWKPWSGNYVQDGLIRGYKFGFIAGGDVHNTKPGDHGLTAVYCDRLTRSSIFDAIVKRRCYATTGAKILVDFHVNGFPMGSVIFVKPNEWEKIFPIKISCGVIGTANLKKIELMENNRVIYVHERWRGPSNQMAFCYIIEDIQYFHRYYYVRIYQTDGHMAWSSPVFFDYIRPEKF